MRWAFYKLGFPASMLKAIGEPDAIVLGQSYLPALIHRRSGPWLLKVDLFLIRLNAQHSNGLMRAVPKVRIAGVMPLVALILEERLVPWVPVFPSAIVSRLDPPWVPIRPYGFRSRTRNGIQSLFPSLNIFIVLPRRAIELLLVVF
jgi:hypothetical protein